MSCVLSRLATWNFLNLRIQSTIQGTKSYFPIFTGINSVSQEVHIFLKKLIYKIYKGVVT